MIDKIIVSASIPDAAVPAPPLALLPLIDLGDAPDADCRALYAKTRVQTGDDEKVTQSR